MGPNHKTRHKCCYYSQNILNPLRLNDAKWTHLLAFAADLFKLVSPFVIIETKRVKEGSRMTHPFPLLLSKDYGIIHYESPDRRGIDVALLYRKSLFKPIETSSHELKIYDDLSRKRVLLTLHHEQNESKLVLRLFD